MELRELPFENGNNLAIRFLVSQDSVDISPAFANAIRRIILAYVPTLAIEEIIIVENTLALMDEFIAHRLGLIPLNSDIELNDQATCDQCEGNGCSACTVTLRLTMETDNKSTAMINSSDLVSDNYEAYPVNSDIPIMKMGPDQRLILEAIARFGNGRDHAKWQPTSSLGYQFMPIIDIKPGIKFSKQIADSCPRSVLSFDEKTQTINIQNLLNCNLCQECTTDGNITVKGDETQIIFYVESTGALPVENIVSKSADILSEMAEEFIESFQEAMENNINDPKLAKKVSTFERIRLSDV